MKFGSDQAQPTKWQFFSAASCKKGLPFLVHPKQIFDPFYFSRHQKSIQFFITDQSESRLATKIISSNGPVCTISSQHHVNTWNLKKFPGFVTTKVILYMSPSDELTLLVQYTTVTFWQPYSCNFQKLKFHETKLYPYKIMLVCFTNVN